MANREEPYVSEITGRGFIKATAICDSKTGKHKCYRLGGVPYARPLTQEQRWRRAKALPESFKYGTQESPTDFTGLSAECPQSGAPFGIPNMTEDCLQCNIWIPSGTPPRGGWPVWMYIHGGFLQWGSPNKEDPSNLLSQTSVRCIIVAPTYRLNVFGFLASHELLDEASANGSTVGNLGFWDQRLALEWTYDNIEGFGGNKKNITVGGLSAGAYSTFHQLAYELGLPDDEALIRRVALFSNGAGLPPKPLREVQSHFDMLLTVLDIPKELDAQSKIQMLRRLTMEQLISATRKLPENSFRAVNDGQWARHTLFQEIEDGRFARAMLRRGIRIMIGDLPDENNVYKLVQPPSSYESLIRRLSVEYPEAASKQLAQIYCPGGALPAGSTWTETFGHIYADVQVHVTARGLLAALARTLPLSSIYRYRINWRAECVRTFMPMEMGVAHGCDLTVWFYGNGYSLLPAEQNLMRKFLEPFAAFLRGEVREYGTGGVEEVRAILPDMSVAIVRDDDWQRCRTIWQSLHFGGLARL